MSANEVCLIYEVHCYMGREDLWPTKRARQGLLRRLFGLAGELSGTTTSPRDFGSVWAKAGPLDPDDEYEEAARKIAGPLPREEAQAVVASLRAVLEEACVRVIEETVADD